jgi:hypothetical protein
MPATHYCHAAFVIIDRANALGIEADAYFLTRLFRLGFASAENVVHDLEPD